MATPLPPCIQYWTDICYRENQATVRDAVMFGEQDSDNMKREYMIIKVSLKLSGDVG
jgi:hypothetical protein